MKRGSQKVWVVSECSYNRTTPLRVFTQKHRAKALADRLTTILMNTEEEIHQLWYTCKPLDLVTIEAR